MNHRTLGTDSRCLSAISSSAFPLAVPACPASYNRMRATLLYADNELQFAPVPEWDTAASYQESERAKEMCTLHVLPRSQSGHMYPEVHQDLQI